jgi:hypothetical protein
MYQMLFSVRDLYMHCSTEAYKSVDDNPFTCLLKKFLLVSNEFQFYRLASELLT